MRVDAFDFELPAELIAQQPLPERDASRLLVVGETFTDRSVRDLPDLLKPGDLLVLNETKVLPTRFAARRRRGDSPVQVTLVADLGGDRWSALVKPGRRLTVGDVVSLAPGLEAVVEAKDATGGLIALALEVASGSVRDAIRTHGAMPLPPYIKRPAAGDPEDLERYQPIFAKAEGSVAAPTASLHFTEPLLQALDARGIGRASLTLHVGLGTFLPVKAEDTVEHRMHAEWFDLPAATVEAIMATRARGGRVVAVGTTVLRVLESQARSGDLKAGSGETALFITPGFEFRVVDRLLTNFHLPRSTLFMLVAALAGLERMQAAYAHAIAARYRFFSYGDACLIDRMA